MTAACPFYLDPSLLW